MRTLTGGRNGDHGYADGTEGNALLFSPTDIAVRPDGKIFGVPYNQEMLFARGEVKVVNNRAMIPVRKLAEKLGGADSI
ncbi:hypothetical protein [Ferviditalea candida]|uniref:Copper amine oxidase-like N-terminal domain-containing protein n=1 Tax=Ferviditalea candida TaxID=3108399 RepID=A0ABU5ZCL0_9BACL|nr:hypothetical protein [Paenibacillaceae bacterium T2]